MESKILRYIGAMLCAVCLVTSCIEEVEPTDGITEEQVAKSPNSVSAMLMALPARFNAYGSSFGPYAFGYGAMMHIRDVQTGDMAIEESIYDHFLAWERNVNIGANSQYMQYIWYYYYQSIRACNNLIAAVPLDTLANEHDRGAKGAAHAFRALFYLDLARAYEFLPCDAFPDSTNTDGVHVGKMTVPVVTENTTEEQAGNNPRVSRDSMFHFILSDLDRAEKLIPSLDANPAYGANRTLPHLCSVYGLKARLYMWVEDYRNALTYAQKAITQAQSDGLSIMTINGSTSLSYAPVAGSGTYFTGFNDPNEFMWAAVQTSDNATVQSGVANWMSWMNPLVTYGYAHAGCRPCIDKSLYDKISPSDWRRYFFVTDSQTYPVGMSTKFAPNQNDYTLPTTSAASAYPIMRIEEMSFIYAEAAAHVNAAMGRAYLQTFMTTNRYWDGTSYRCPATTQQGIIEEIVLQKRIELWGEGQTFFDIKRLNMSVTRGYEGSNFSSLTRFNTNGRPAWTNWVIVLNEENTNKAVLNHNNPDPTDCYTPYVE